MILSRFYLQDKSDIIMHLQKLKDPKKQHNLLRKATAMVIIHCKRNIQ